MPKDLRTRRINLSMTEREAAQLRAAAEAMGLTVSAYIRSVGLLAAKRRLEEAEA